MAKPQKRRIEGGRVTPKGTGSSGSGAAAPSASPRYTPPAPRRDQLPSPVLRAPARLHTDQARRPVGKVLQELLALELHTHGFAGLRVEPVQLKNPLGNVNADDRFASIHLGPSGLPVKICVSSPLGTSMP